MHLLLVKKSPQQVGYGILGRFNGRNSKEDASRAAFDWAHRVSMDWRFRIADISDYGDRGRYAHEAYYDDTQQPNPQRRN